MLIELHIENFAIIDHLDIHFKDHLIIFTGETGAGKSIIVDAVETVLGGRADTTMIRAGSERAYVEGAFTIPEATRPEVIAILDREELLAIADQENLVTLGREIRMNGRNVARVNGRNVNAALLREIGEFLLDVHGQSEHLSLLHVGQHLGLLDRYALTESASTVEFQKRLEAYRQVYKQIQSVRRELEQLHTAERDAARRADMLAYQIQDIETARLHPGEDEDLRKERDRLANAESLAKLTTECLVALDEGEPDTSSITDLLGTVLHSLSSLARLDPSQAGLAEQAQSAFETLSDLSIALRDYQENIEFNPKRLDQVEDRLALIANLKRKYGDTIPAILDFAASAHKQLELITHAGERLDELQAEHDRLLDLVGQEGQALSRLRQAAARKMSQAIEAELIDLHMAGARFTVDFQLHPDPHGTRLENGQNVAFSGSGLEKIEFLIAPNPGEGFKPLAKIASGGETSRLMLALKNVLAKADHIPTLIFDEIDQGIGGRVGGIVGAKLWNLARQHQVLCITHLPQLAAYGDQHFHVLKQVEGGRTSTLVKSLVDQERLKELALMMGDISEGTLHSAREILQQAERQMLKMQ